MAVTKILSRSRGMDVAIRYVLNGDKTDGQILTAYHNCTPLNPYRVMMQTKEHYGKNDGVLCFHIIQSFAPGEVNPSQTLEIAKKFCEEHLPGYEAVIGVHVDKEHIYAHTVFNSVNQNTGKKYHSTPQSYFQQIRGISDRLCREYGLSVIMRGETSKAVSYVEWLREQKGQPTFRSMLKADIDMAIEDANDLGHFFMLMEHMGYEIRYGKHLAFRLHGQERFIRADHVDTRYTEDGIQAAIEGNLDAIELGRKPVLVSRKPYTPIQPTGKLKGFLALYVHYLYLLGKIGKQQYPPRMTPHLKQELIKLERYKEQFRFLRVNGIQSAEQLTAYKTGAEERVAALTKQRTILNVRKKKHRELFDALADAEALCPVKELYASGLTGIEEEFARYIDAVGIIEKSGIPRKQLAKEKAELYEAIADINREIRGERKKIGLCDEIAGDVPRMGKELESKSVQAKESDSRQQHHYRRNQDRHPRQGDF